MWYFVASISFRSTKAFADYLNEPAAFEELQSLPLLPLTPKQRGMIGEARVHESFRAQLRARKLETLPPRPEVVPEMNYFTSDRFGDASVSAAAWARTSTQQVAIGTRKTGNHVCRADVCHKGRIGRKGFCRMFFWHWARRAGKSGEDVASICHGFRLQPRWNGTGPMPLYSAPPFHGLPAQ